MAAVIQLSSASANMEGYLNGWTSGYSSTYGAFWDEGNGLVTNPLATTVYEQWGNGSTGGNGIYMEGEFQYSRGNLTGTVDSITLGTGFSQSASTGFSVSADLVITPDSTFPSASQDVFDWAIYDLTVNSSLDSLYDYLAAVGTEVRDTAASDTLVGFGGADTFVFSSGNDIVKAGPAGTYGYQDGVDTLDVSGWYLSDFSELTFSNLNGNAVIGNQYTSDTITLNGVSSSVLDASDFLFA
ncbi:MULTISPECIES: hypothetical protein [unclassified Rhizobium]|uniref:hypothetical protein n=1 Tax=unclassified Rhizobium TaxID=2613769 RepID=UPI00024E28FF|nr:MULTISPECIES: hypothetical protein [unclassified Rhizobium]EHS53663.1 hypothetical protein PDO_4073 [Rhizobium sp. PDO1-076]UJW77081.1 hypothetical protein IM739_21595 [Rhizobium sp. SL42]